MNIESFLQQHLQNETSPYQALCSVSPHEHLRGRWWPIWD